MSVAPAVQYLVETSMMEPVSFYDTQMPCEPDDGWIRLAELQLPVRFLFNSGTDKDISPIAPSISIIPPDGRSLMVWVHESVPEYLRGVVLAHEVFETSLTLNGVPRKVAHRIARAFERAYAMEHLTAERFEWYREWRAQLPDHSQPLTSLLD